MRAREQVAKIVSKNDPDTKKVWCKYGKIPGQGDGVNLFLLVKLMLRTDESPNDFYQNH